MNDFDDIAMFLARAGCLYVKSGLSPPFHLRAFAEAWWLEGISLEHCIEQLIIHLAKTSSQYRNGSGDWGLRWLDAEIRQSWDRLNWPPRTMPERTDEVYKRDGTGAMLDDGICFVDRVDKEPSTSEAKGLKQIDKAMIFLRGELAEGEVEAVRVEQNARTVAIAPRTLDRARKRLGVVSRRTGFAETGKCWLSLPPTAP
jgi:hypothetical protein